MSVVEVRARVDIGRLITRTPGIKHGAPHIAGTGISVRTIVRWHQRGLTPEEIADRYEDLGLDQVHAALSCYYANQAEVDADLRFQEAEAARLEQQAKKTNVAA